MDVVFKTRGVRSVVMVALIGALGTAVYQAYQAARQRQEVRVLAEQIQQLRHERDDLAERLTALSTKRTPRLPAPPTQTQPAAQSAASADQNILKSANLVARFKDKPAKLTVEQAEAYLRVNGRTAPFLLASYRTSGDSNLLAEAMEKYPGNALVAFEALFNANLSHEQRRQWLNAFAQAGPENALPNYLSAREYFKAGQADRAVEELIAASGKSQFQDYTLSRRQDNEEAYLASGYSVAEAKFLGSDVELPQLSELKQLGLQMVDLANSYRKAGDDASAQAILQMAVNLGQNYTENGCAVSHLVGLVIQRNALSAMDANGAYGDSGQTVQQRLDQLTQQKASISSLFRQNEALLQNMSDQDWVSYIDRDKTSGEQAALRWAISKFGQK